jgi:hypothetical protein
MSTNGRKTDARSEVKTEGFKPQQSAGVERMRITRSNWARTPKDFKGWYDFNDGKGRVRSVLTMGPHGTTLSPVQIIPDEEG